MIDMIVNFLSGEFFLRKKPNGGGIVLARSTFVSLWLYSIALFLKSYTDTGANFAFSASELKTDINATLPWLGAIFAAIYAAFYTRYSNQWSYLATTYNQFMAAKTSIPAGSYIAKRSLVYWQAGFVSDAFTLHLDRKPIFKGVIDHLLKDPVVCREILANFSDKELEEFTRRHLA